MRRSINAGASVSESTAVLKILDVVGIDATSARHDGNAAIEVGPRGALGRTGGGAERLTLRPRGEAIAEIQVGLCHGVHHVEGQIARFLGVEGERISSYGIGLNHLTFLTRLRLDGADAVPLIQSRLTEQAPGLQAELAGKMVWDNLVAGRAPRFSDDPFSWGIFRQYGVFPCAMDRHAVEFYPERFPDGLYCGHTLGRDAFPIDERIALGDTWYDEMLAIARSPDPLPPA